jgi:hypothetical protein
MTSWNRVHAHNLIEVNNASNSRLQESFATLVQFEVAISGKSEIHCDDILEMRVYPTHSWRLVREAKVMRATRMKPKQYSMPGLEFYSTLRGLSKASFQVILRSVFAYNILQTARGSSSSCPETCKIVVIIVTLGSVKDDRTSQSFPRTQVETCYRYR